ncbi:hypothetical protein P3S68_007432 [Capsicum galapagoense]
MLRIDGDGATPKAASVTEPSISIEERNRSKKQTNNDVEPTAERGERPRKAPVPYIPPPYNRRPSTSVATVFAPLSTNDGASAKPRTTHDNHGATDFTSPPNSRGKETPANPSTISEIPLRSVGMLSRIKSAREKGR